MSDRLTDEDLARLAKLESEAAPTPWGEQWCYGACRHIDKNVDRDCFLHDEIEEEGWGRYDGPFIAAARNALPALLAEVRASRAEIAGLKADLAMASGTIHAQDDRDRERRAGERCGITYEWHGCDWPDAMAEEVLRLRAERDALKARLEKLVFEATLMASQARDLIRGKEEAGRWARAFEKLAALARGSGAIEERIACLEDKTKEGA